MLGTARLEAPLPAPREPELLVFLLANFAGVIAMREEEVAVAIAGIIGVFGLPFVACVIWMFLHYLFAAFRTWQETGLKRDMISRGYTVQEIIEVVGARRGCKTKSRHSDVPPAKPIRQPAYVN